MAKKAHEKMLTISSHKGNANQNHTKFHLTPVRLAIIKNTTTNKVLVRMWGKRNLHTLLVGMQAGATTLEKKNLEAS
jgi:hypothetical protein